MKFSGTETVYVRASTGSVFNENSGRNVANTNPVNRIITIVALAVNPQIFEANLMSTISSFVAASILTVNGAIPNIFAT
jgi:hypothetical protein